MSRECLAVLCFRPCRRSSCSCCFASDPFQPAVSPTTLELALPSCIHSNQMKKMGLWDQIRPESVRRTTALPNIFRQRALDITVVLLLAWAMLGIYWDHVNAGLVPQYGYWYRYWYFSLAMSWFLNVISVRDSPPTTICRLGNKKAVCCFVAI